jgi:hypothetical protein
MAAGAGATVAYPSASAVEIQHANYSLNDLPGQAAQLRASFATSSSFDGAAEAQPSASGVSAPALQGETARISVSRLRDATACLDRAFGNPDGSLARVIAADFEGHSAYFGVYLSGPDAGLPPTLLQLDVAAVHGCRLLAQSTARL